MKNLELLDEIAVADIMSHSGLQALPNGLQGGKMAHQTFLAAMGAPSTGKKVTFSGMSVFRIANGKIVEHWGAYDALSKSQNNGALEELDEEGSTSTRHPTSPHFRNASHSICVHYLLSKCAACSYAYY
jgi:hypothetical protein